MGLIPAGLSAAIFWVDVQTPLGVADGILYVVVVLLALPNRRPLPVACWASLATCLILAGWALSPPGGEAWKVASNRVLSTFAVWAVAAIGIAHHRAADRLRRAEAELARGEALASLGKVAAILAHQIRNPMSSVLAAAKSLSRGASDPRETRELRELLDLQSGRLGRLLEEFLGLARQSRLELTEADLGRDLGTVLKELRLKPPGVAPSP